MKIWFIRKLNRIDTGTKHLRSRFDSNMGFKTHDNFVFRHSNIWKIQVPIVFKKCLNSKLFMKEKREITQFPSGLFDVFLLQLPKPAFLSPTFLHIPHRFRDQIQEYG